MARISVALVSLLFLTFSSFLYLAMRRSDPDDRARAVIALSPFSRFVVLTLLAVWSTIWELSQDSGSTHSAPWVSSILPHNIGFISFCAVPLFGFGVYFGLWRLASRQLLKQRWSAWAILQLVWWRLVNLVVPTLMVVDGFDSLLDGRLVGAWWVAGAGFTALLGGAFLRTAEGMKLHGARAGETRNRALSIARRMGAKVGRVFIVPEGKGHLTNAFGWSDAVGVTDNLGKYLTRPQQDYIIAHEVAHAKNKHGRIQLLVTIGVYSMLIVLLFLLRGAMGGWRPVVLGLTVAAPLVVMDFVSRCCEYRADREAVKFTRDPETAIRALIRLHRIALAPANCSQFAQLFLSHPCLTRRVRAIARRQNLPAERVSAILANAEP